MSRKEQASRARFAGRGRGFTLVEVLVVVAMIGVLATLAIMSFKRLVSSAGSSEAVAMIQSIRAAEEAYKAETLVYLGCSGDLTKYYPQTSQTPDTRKWNWVNPNHPDYACWNMLHASADGAVQFGYAVVAGAPGAQPPITSLSVQPSWPAVQEPWFVVQAAGDRDGDGKYAIAVGSSFVFGSGSGLVVENDDE